MLANFINQSAGLILIYHINLNFMWVSCPFKTPFWQVVQERLNINPLKCCYHKSRFSRNIPVVLSSHILHHAVPWIHFQCSINSQQVVWWASVYWCTVWLTYGSSESMTCQIDIRSSRINTQWLNCGCTGLATSGVSWEEEDSTWKNVLVQNNWHWCRHFYQDQQSAVDIPAPGSSCHHNASQYCGCRNSNMRQH
jgi:hypothetical protein